MRALRAGEQGREEESAPRPERVEIAKLDQLTSLRFFAAFMIVIQHSNNLFGIRNPAGFNFGQGVSFFFVLSGFILTYVYPKLETWPDVRRFWRARVARIWPAYLTSFLLGFWLLHYPFDIRTATAHLFLVQGWIPKSRPHGADGNSATGRFWSNPGRAGVAACSLVALLAFSMGGRGSIDRGTVAGRGESVAGEGAVDRPAAALEGFAGRRFADLFTLRGVDVACVSGGLSVTLRWESDADQSLRFSNAIHLVNERGEILGQADYRQSAEARGVRRGDTWADTFSIPKEKVTDRVKSLAIGIYDDTISLLPITEGNTDWEGRRLVIPVHECSGKP